MKISKFILGFTLTLLGSFAWALPDYVAKWTETPGLVMNPRSPTLYLEKSGQLLLVEEYQDGHVEQKDLGLLSSVAMEKVLQKISYVNPNANLVDPDPTAPICADLPGQMIFVQINNQDFKTYQSASCHTWNLDDNSADAINTIMMGLSQLVE